MASVLARIQALVAAAEPPSDKAEPTSDGGKPEAGHKAEPEARPSTGDRARSEEWIGTQPVRRQELDKLVGQRMGDLRRLSRLHPASKVLQQAEWDCGLACVCMVLRAFGRATTTVAQLEQQAQTQSVWTVDLAFLLHRNVPQADFTYYTTCAGINPAHASSQFYSDALDVDQRRVASLFAAARIQQAVRVVELAMPLLDLQRFLVHRHYVAIMLVDAAALRCICCAPRQRPRRMRAWLARWRHGGACFAGHYIMLIDYIPSLDLFVYRDPAITDEFCLATARTIDTARAHPGTDADCIIVKVSP
ncbi:hypothetical protein GGF46_003955 [Coemansia sp. RSA 552]|nr:hypothetical protein GGF46_003955 [Coemansia sp. RSA 552]